MYRRFTTWEAWTDTGLDRNVPVAQLGRQLSSQSRPIPTDPADVQRVHRIRPRLPARKAAPDTPGPPITNRPQQPSDSVAGRTTKFELTSKRNRRGGELAATELAAAPHASRVTAARSPAVFRIVLIIE